MPELQEFPDYVLKKLLTLEQLSRIYMNNNDLYNEITTTIESLIMKTFLRNSWHHLAKKTL